MKERRNWLVNIFSENDYECSIYRVCGTKDEVKKYLAGLAAQDREREYGEYEDGTESAEGVVEVGGERLSAYADFGGRIIYYTARPEMDAIPLDEDGKQEYFGEMIFVEKERAEKIRGILSGSAPSDGGDEVAVSVVFYNGYVAELSCAHDAGSKEPLTEISLYSPGDERVSHKALKACSFFGTWKMKDDLNRTYVVQVEAEK